MDAGQRMNFSWEFFSRCLETLGNAYKCHQGIMNSNDWLAIGNREQRDDGGRSSTVVHFFEMPLVLGKGDVAGPCLLQRARRENLRFTGPQKLALNPFGQLPQSFCHGSILSSVLGRPLRCTPDALTVES